MNIKWNSYGQKTDVKNDFAELNGEVIKSISGAEQGSDEVVITTESGKAIKLYHDQDCCESVEINDVEGCAEDLIGAIVVSAEEVDGDCGESSDYESYTWTFYKLETSKGGLWIRWLGSSNGYYSERVSVIGGRVQ